MVGQSKSAAQSPGGGLQRRRRPWPWASPLMTVVIVAALMTPGPAVPDVGFDGMDLVAHLLLFGAWGAAVQWEFGLRWWVLLLVGAGFAVATESMQTLAIERTFSLSDIAADLLGITLGAVAAQAWRRRSFQAAEQR